MANPIQVYDNTESLHNIGQFIMNFQPYQNAFLSALVNRIGLTIVTSKMWNNPWSVFKQGYMEFGETVEEIFANISKPHSFSPSTAEDEVFKREIPDVRAAFHTMNYQKFYKATIQNDQLRQAFLSWSGITDLIAKIVDTLYTGMNYDEYVTMKYMLCREILDGQMTYETVSSSDNKDTVQKMRAMSTKFTFLNADYNRAGVHNAADRSEQYIIISSDYEAEIDVDVLAVAFHMDKAEFLGRLIVIDSFDEHDTARLEELFGDDPSYSEFSAGEKTSLGKLHGILMARDWWMVFDNFQEMTQNYNGEGLYWNYWLHCWKTFSVSPFANAAVFTEETGSITSVTVSPSTANMYPATAMSFTAAVVTSGIIDDSVRWSISASADFASGTKIDPYSGYLTIDAEEENTEITVTAKSVADSTKSGTATVTVVNPS